ncbi:Carnitine O-palmitoyltransferase 1, liver isoform [Exaiptasia diaphana]|nr:Carnitine O-palmitoyltransferase 1, liver isoform [Exaiptasia diaphana]
MIYLTRFICQKNESYLDWNVSDLREHLPPSVASYQYADDTTILTSCRPAELVQTASKMNDTLEALSTWSSNSHLALNSKKTKAMLVSTSQMSRVHSLDNNHPTVSVLDKNLDYVNANKILGDFEKTLGPKLQFVLQLKSWWAPNYHTDWWEKYVYLMGRSPLPINSNYYGMDQGWYPTREQPSRAAAICYFILNYRQEVEAETLEPLTIRNTIPTCMWQYERQFKTVSQTDTKKWWSECRRMCGMKKSTPDLVSKLLSDNCPSKDSIQSLANKINDAFLEPQENFQPLHPDFHVNTDGLLAPVFTVDIVEKVLNSTIVSKAGGPDNIPNWVLKEFSYELAQPLCDIINFSLSNGSLPSIWKCADVCPLPK